MGHGVHHGPAPLHPRGDEECKVGLVGLRVAEACKIEKVCACVSSVYTRTHYCTMPRPPQIGENKATFI